MVQRLCRTYYSRHATLSISSGGWRWSPTATLSNEFRIGRLYSQPDFFRTDAPRSEFFTVPLITNVEPLNGTAIFRPQGRAVTTTNAQDTVSWLHGNHSFRFGAQYQKVKIYAYNDAGNLPVYNLGLSTAGPTINFAALAAPGTTITTTATANSLLALLGGIISSGSQTFNAPNQTSGYVAGATRATPFTFKLYAPYFLDQWKVSPSLTLNLGIRWDYQTPVEIDTGAHFEPVIAPGRNPVDAVLDPNGSYQFVGGNAGRKNAMYKPDKNNWAPSFGFAWAPTNIENGFLKGLTGKNFVLRAGYRRSYVNDETVTAPNNALVGNAGFQTGISALRQVTPTTTSTALDDRAGATHISTITTPVFASAPTYRANNTASFSSFGTVFAIDPNLQTPNQNDYQVGIQRQFGDWVAELRYVGGYSKNMLRTIDYNQTKLPAQFIAEFATVRANVIAGCPAGCTANAPFTAQASGGNITPTNVLGVAIKQGAIAEFANILLINGIIPNNNTFPVPSGDMRSLFLPNPNTGVANVLLNGGHYNYNAGQFELRRRFKDGLYLQANYTFSKELTDAVGTGQTRVEPFLDNNNPGLDYTRADYDQTHVINVNAIYELPFGKGHRWVNSNKWLDYAIGGWQLGLVWRVASGAPITFTDARGTLNRAARSARQTALTNLTDKQLKQYIGVFKTKCGVFYINPIAINIHQQALAAGNCSSLNIGLTSGLYPGTPTPVPAVGGAGTNGFGTPSFPGQIFFSNGPNSTSGMRRAIVNGPWLSSADISLLKNFRITERVTFQLRGEAYNFTNTPYFAPGQFIDINSTSFGRISGVSVASRVVQVAGRLSF